MSLNDIPVEVRERRVRQRYVEHPTPPDARVRHIFPPRPGGDMHIRPGERAYCGHVMARQSVGTPVSQSSPGDLCIVCCDLNPKKAR